MSRDEAIERQAFNELYRRTYGFVRDRARMLLRDDEGALDAAQEVFVRVWEKWNQVAGATSQVGWLIVTTTRLCLDKLRHRKIVRAQAQAQSEEASEVSAPAQEGGHLARLLVLRLSREKPIRQQIVIHSWVDGMTQDEVAAQLGISRKTVQRQLDAFRAQHAGELAALAEVDHD